MFICIMNAHKQFSDFKRGRNVPYNNCILSFHAIATRIGDDRMTIISNMKSVFPGQSDPKRPLCGIAVSPGH